MTSKKLQRTLYSVWENLDLTFLLLGVFVYEILSRTGKIPDLNIVSSIILGALSLLAISMIRIRNKFDKTVEIINHANVYNNQEEMYDEIENYIRSRDLINEATLIQYSGETVKRIARDLVSKGAHVTLYVQAINTAQKFSKHQVERIKKFPDSIVTEFAEVYSKNKTKQGSLVVYEYDSPASLRAIRIDNKILAVGWYIYTYIDKEDTREKQKYQKYPDDDIKLLGHNQPGELLYYGSREYDVMNDLLEHLVENFDKHTKLTNKKPIFEFGVQPHD